MICRTRQQSTFLMCEVQNQSQASGIYPPDLRRRIWSFWQSSMKPVMRFANSTTYWIAWVIWMAHCCHRASLVFRENRHGKVKQWASGFISALRSSGGLAERRTPQTPPPSPGRASSISASQGTRRFSLEGCFHKLTAPVIWALALPLERVRMHCPTSKCDSNVGFCARQANSGTKSVNIPEHSWRRSGTVLLLCPTEYFC